MKIGVVNESTTVYRFVLHTLLRNITHLAVITRKTNIKFGILKGGETGKKPIKFMFLCSGGMGEEKELFHFVEIS